MTGKRPTSRRFCENLTDQRHVSRLLARPCSLGGRRLDSSCPAGEHADVSSAEESLVTRARSGDSRALDELLATHLPSLRAYLRLHLPAQLRARESCSDLVNSVCREVLQDGNDFEYRGPEAFRGWLFAWARHKLQERTRYWHAEKRDIAREHVVSENESLGQLAGVYRGLGSPSAAAIG